MKRILLSFLAALLVLAAPAAAPASAQVPVASPVATATPFALPANHLILRIRAGNGFDYVRLDDGALAYHNQHLIANGVSTAPIPAWLVDWYATIGVSDAYVTQAVMNADVATGPVAVDVRLLAFPDDAAAAAAIPAAFGSLLRQAGEVPDGARVSIMDGQSVIAVTGYDPPVEIGATMPGETSMPFTRLIARQGAMVTTVKVSSTDAAFNETVARDLLAAQLDCIDANVACTPVTIPAGNEFMPGTPVAAVNRIG